MGDGSVATVIRTNNDSVYVPDGTYVRHYRLPIVVWSTTKNTSLSTRVLLLEHWNIQQFMSIPCGDVVL
jgi:hypothetical protein